MAALLKFSLKVSLERGNLLQIIGLTVAVAMVYWPTYRFDFLDGWDDQWFVINHYTEGGLNRQNVWDILTHFYYGQYAPLNQLYYTTLYTVFGYNASCFHIAGVLIHLVNVILIYRLINALIPVIYGNDASSYTSMGFITAIIFAVIPINVEPVAWVSASKVTIYASYYLLSLLCYTRYLTLQKPRYFYFTLLLFVFSFGAKEQAVTLPVYLVLVDYLFARKLSDRALWLEKLPFIIAALLFGIVTIQSQNIKEDEMVFYALDKRLPLIFYTMSEYLTKTLVPVNLSYLYPFPYLVGEKVPWWFWTYLFLPPAIVYCFWDQMKAKWLCFGSFFFLIHIVLVLNLFPLARHSLIADRYTYVAAIGICFVLSHLLMTCLKMRRGRGAVLITGMLYLAILAGTLQIISACGKAFTL